MENAVQALKTAAAVLIFVIAITVAFTMFSRAKTTADAVVKSQDTQEYLEAAELESTLYTSSEAIQSGTSSTTTGDNATMTTDGYRIVKPDDVISTIYRYNLEKYGVTIVESNGNVIARFDSNTENLMRQWYNIKDGTDSEGKTVTANAQKEKYATKLKENTTVKVYNETIEPNFSIQNLEEIYRIKVTGNDNITCGAPWYGSEKEIIKRINTDIDGQNPYTLNGQEYKNDKKLNEKLKNKKIVEVVNTIDNSKYLNDKDKEGQDIETKLLQEYQLPTIEVIYIIY